MFRLLGFFTVSKVPPLLVALLLSLAAHGYFFVFPADSKPSQLMAKQGGVRASLTLSSFRARPKPAAAVVPKPVPKKTIKKAIKKKPTALPKSNSPLLETPPAKKVMAASPLLAEPLLEEHRQLNQDNSSAPVSMAQLSERKVGIVTRAVRYREQPPAPAYPKLALKRRQSGEVLLRLLIGRLGNIEASQVIRSSGFKLLDRAALSSVRRWKFEPWMENGIAQQSWVEVPVDFTIKRR